MTMLRLVLMILCLVFLALATFNVGSPRFNLGWAGMFCWALTVLLPFLR